MDVSKLNLANTMSSLTSITSGAAARPDFTQIQQRLFAKADANGDGGIDQDEFQTMLQKSPRLAKDFARLAGTSDSSSASNLADIFKKLDADGDGKISAAEFKSGVTAARKAAHSQGGDGCQPPPQGDFSDILKKVFSDGDSDGDGTITSSDLTAMMQKTPGLARDLSTLVSSTSSSSDTSSTSTDDIFKALDTNGDGKVDQSEFTTAVTQAHDKIMAQHGAGGPPPPPPPDAASENSGTTSTGSAASSKEVQTFLLEMMRALQQQNAAYAPDGSSTSTSGTASTFSTIA